MKHPLIRTSVGTLLAAMFAVSTPAAGQEKPAPGETGLRRVLLFSPTSQDVILPITSIEWGAPDRWSFTSRYIHMFDKDRDNKPVLNNFTLSLSPGTAGGRFGIGYERISGTGKGGSRREPAITLLSEARAVLLRTWRNPLETSPNRTFAGAEVRCSIAGLVNVGVGYFAPLSAAGAHRTAIWSLHAGVGI